MRNSLYNTVRLIGIFSYNSRSTRAVWIQRFLRPRALDGFLKRPGAACGESVIRDLDRFIR